MGETPRHILDVFKLNYNRILGRNISNSIAFDCFHNRILSPIRILPNANSQPLLGFDQNVIIIILKALLCYE